MRKFILGVTLLLAALFIIVSFGQEEVLSTNIEPEVIDNKLENENTAGETVAEVTTPEKPPEQAPEIKEDGKMDLTYAEVIELIETDNKKTVENPDDLLVLVNKENNLPASYVPKDLVIPNVPFSFQGEDQKKHLRKAAALALEELIAKAAEAGHKIYAVSGYRSYERQKAIFLGNVQKFGFKKTNTFSAVPGQSEHQTGLAMDVSSESVNYRLVNNFGETPEGKWLNDNAHLFGFIIRYPKDKVDITGYQYEPWHIRYVGIESATAIKMNSLTLEEYLHNQLNN